MTQRKTQHTGGLRALVRAAGMNMREVSTETGIAESTLHNWATRGVIPKRDRPLLARVIGCDVQELAQQHEYQEDKSKKLGLRYMTDEKTRIPFSLEEWDGCFSFGGLKTTSMILDGDGTETYLPSNIHTHYDPQPATFFEEVLQAKQQIEREQEENRASGKGYQWNGEKYHLSRIVVSRESNRENMTLGLWFKPRDHYTGLATRRCLDDPAFRAKYLPEDWYTPVVGMSCSLGVDITVITSDDHVLLAQRGGNLSVNQGAFTTSTSEAVSPTLDRGTSSRAPDLYHTAARGISEELGIDDPGDFSLSDILFLTFSVDTRYALYGLKGMVRANKSADEILRNWHSGAKDKMENKKIHAVPFTPEDVCAFVFSHEPWGGGLVCLYHTLVHEFGRSEVNAVIASYGSR